MEKEKDWFEDCDYDCEDCDEYDCPDRYDEEEEDGLDIGDESWEEFWEHEDWED